MNFRNIIKSIAVIGAGLIIYKLLLGFVLPIAMFVSLGYILKVLLKGSDTNLEKDELSPMTSNLNDSSSIEDIVEIKPLEVNKTIQKDNIS